MLKKKTKQKQFAFDIVEKSCRCWQNDLMREKKNPSLHHNKQFEWYWLRNHDQLQRKESQLTLIEKMMSNWLRLDLIDWFTLFSIYLILYILCDNCRQATIVYNSWSKSSSGYSINSFSLFMKPTHITSETEKLRTFSHFVHNGLFSIWQV